MIKISLPPTDKGMLKDSSSTVDAEEANAAELLVNHTDKYLQSLNVGKQKKLLVSHHLSYHLRTPR